MLFRDLLLTPVSRMPSRAFTSLRIRVCYNFLIGLNSNVSPPYKVTWCFKHHAGSSCKQHQRLRPLSRSVRIQLLVGCLCSLLCSFEVFKRGKTTAALGAFHGSDIPEFYGTGLLPDFIGTDALGNENLPLWLDLCWLEGFCSKLCKYSQSYKALKSY